MRGSILPSRVSPVTWAPPPANATSAVLPSHAGFLVAGGPTAMTPAELCRRRHGHYFIKPLLRGTTLLFEGALAMRGFRHRYVTTSVGRMHALVARGSGQGPPVVVIPGLSSNIAEYGRALWQLRSAASWVIGIDLPGHGRSAAPRVISDINFNKAICETLQTLCPKPAVVIGHSLGGYFAMRYALARGQSVKKMLLVCPVGAPFTEEERLTHMQLFGVHSNHAAREVAERAWSKSFGRYRMIVAAVRARLGSPIVQSVVHSDIFNASLTPARLGTLPMPVAILWGAEDALLPLRQLAYFRNHIKTVTMAEVLPGVGHGVLASGRENIIRPILNFIQAHHHDIRPIAQAADALREPA